MQPTFTDSFFSSRQELYRGEAPGRMDVMGGIADYSGSLVLQMPIREKTTVTMALRPDQHFRIKSIHPDEQVASCTIAYTQLVQNNEQIDYAYAQQQLLQVPGGEWASYIVGCFLVLYKEKGIKVKGADILVESQVPLGKGVSSSAALEVATMRALAKAYPIQFNPTELPILAQKVENLVVGAPCGLMDQLASALGERGKLLPILCQPDKVQELVAIPEGIYFVGIDSGVKHSVSGASYTDVRTAAFMGYSMIALQEGTTNEQLSQARATGDFSALPYQGYLANISPADFEVKFAPKLYYQMSGSYFIGHHPVHIDSVTQVDKEKLYAILNCTRHPVYENFRVNTFALLLQYLSTIKDTVLREKCLLQLGELMYQSHAGYSVCGLGNTHTDEIVQIVRQNHRNGVYGAKITGGGSGGTVCILCDGEKGLQTARNIYNAYKEKHGLTTVFFE